MALDTVSEYATATRALLQDTVSPYRYSDADFVFALNMAVREARRLRPDLFLGVEFEMPEYTAVNSDEVEMDDMFRMALVYYCVGWLQARDDEPTQDQRALTFITMAKQLLVGL